jgi:hypothetical protein
MLPQLVALLAIGAGSDLRCVAKISEALVGYGPERDVDPTKPIEFTETLLASENFVKGFAGFINARFNRTQGEKDSQEAVYFAVRHVLANNLPWRDVFAGRFGWVHPNLTEIVEDPTGVGYFTNLAWQTRYAGNDVDGFMLIAAYRIVQNMTGKVLVPSPFNGDASANVVGRSNEPCRSCHFDSPFALDKIARLLPMRRGAGARVELLPPQGGPVEILDGASYNDLRSAVERLIDSDDHRFWTCRTVFEFLYGRPEYACESLVFDACVDAYTARGDIRDAIRAVVLDESFCGATP